MKAADVMSRDVVTLSPGHSVKHAAALMLAHHVSGIPVVDEAAHMIGVGVTAQDPPDQLITSRRFHAKQGGGDGSVVDVHAVRAR